MTYIYISGRPGFSHQSEILVHLKKKVTSQKKCGHQIPFSLNNNKNIYFVHSTGFNREFRSTWPGSSSTLLLLLLLLAGVEQETRRLTQNVGHRANACEREDARAYIENTKHTHTPQETGTSTPSPIHTPSKVGQHPNTKRTCTSQQGC